VLAAKLDQPNLALNPGAGGPDRFFWRGLRPADDFALIDMKALSWRLDKLLRFAGSKSTITG
jgi:hypothetical protein